MEKTLGQELIEALREALAYAKGEETGAKVHIIDVTKARPIQKRETDAPNAG